MTSSKNANASGGPPRSPARGIAVAIGILAMAVFGAWWAGLFDGARRNEKPREEGQKGAQEVVSRDECVRLEELKNRSLAYLENSPGNKNFARPVAGFKEICQALPNDPLGPRNLAITVLMEIVDVDLKLKDREKTAVEDAKLAIDLMKKVDPKSAPTHILTGHLYSVMAGKNMIDRDEGFALARAAYAEGTRLAPDDPLSWFLEFRALQAAENAADDDAQAEALRKDQLPALKKAWNLDPDNLYITTELLQLQADLHDPEIAKTFERFFATTKGIPGMLERIGRVFRDDQLEKSTSAAIEAAQKGDWDGIDNSIAPRSSTIRSEIFAQEDQTRVDKQFHEREKSILDFVLSDFLDNCARRVDDSLALGGGIPVQFKEFPPDSQLPPVADIRDLRLADFDFDRKLDAILLAGKKVQVYMRLADGGWKLECEFELPFTCDHLLVADLDQDRYIIPKSEDDRSSDRPEQEGPGANVNVDSPREEIQAATADDLAEAHVAQNPAEVAGYDVDLVVYGAQGVVIFRNDLDLASGRRSLSRVEQAPELTSLVGITAGFASDIFHDGDLDLGFHGDQGLSLWSNRGNGQFVVDPPGAMAFSRLATGDNAPPQGMAVSTLTPIDWDSDVDFDLILCGPEAGPLGWLENLRHAQYRWNAWRPEPPPGLGSNETILLDADSNGAWDLLLAGNTGLRLLRRKLTTPTKFEFMDVVELSTKAFSGAATWDYDNDGGLDVIAWSPERVEIHRGDGVGGFEKVALLSGSQSAGAKFCRVGDFDSDGDQDLMIVGEEGARIFSNEGGNKNHWIDFWLLAGFAKEQNKKNRIDSHGLGAILEARSGQVCQRVSVSGQVTHLGLGARGGADIVRIIWSNGIPQNVIGPKMDVTIAEAQVLGGSCPYLYTWTGERFEFFTDCLWASPLGLQFAEGVFAPAREWEYLSIPGASLRPNGNRYSLRMTEELWELCYLDQIKLIAVDHPRGTQVHSNEKVGPEEIARRGIHTVRNPRIPVAARDQRGRDVLAKIRDADSDYLQGFESRLAPGIAEDHFLELDLGPLENPDKVTLLLTGWIFPSGTSVNVAASSHPLLKGPKSPSLWVPNASGEWEEVIPYMGFPGGKTKTIAVDLSRRFLTDDHRVRIVTNMEIYWDQAYFTCDEAPVETESIELPLVSAELRYRGFSRRDEGQNHGPERYDYQEVDPNPKWPPLAGGVTRFGDVAQLLSAPDDRMVIFGAGDELALEFDIGPPPKEGWTRDFLLYDVGWDKDADLNTAYGQTVGPLPFHGMSGYPFLNGEAYPLSPENESYLRTYQTREQSPVAFWRLMLRRPSEP